LEKQTDDNAVNAAKKRYEERLKNKVAGLPPPPQSFTPTLGEQAPNSNVM